MAEVTLSRLDEGFDHFLREIYVESVYLDPIEDIIRNVVAADAEPRHLPYGAFWGQEKVGFFTLAFSSPQVAYRPNDPASCWLDSFFVAAAFQGRGLAKRILSALKENLKRWHPFVSHLHLTVNQNNRIAQSLYGNCGFTDTGEMHTGGPAGPQHIYTLSL